MNKKQKGFFMKYRVQYETTTSVNIA